VLHAPHKNRLSPQVGWATVLVEYAVRVYEQPTECGREKGDQPSVSVRFAPSLRRFELQRVVADELRRATARLFAEEADEETPSRDACGMAARSRHAFGDRLGRRAITLDDEGEK